MTLEQRLYLASRAKEVTENEAYIDAFESIKTEIETQWQSSPARDTDGRERLWLMQSLLQKLQLTLQSTMDSGKLAQVEIDFREKTRLQKLNEWLK